MNGLTFFQFLLPLAAAALFLWAAGAGLARLATGAPAEEKKPVEKKAVLCAGLLCFAACALGTAFFICCGLAKCPGAPLETALREIFPSSIDADHYLKLAQYGYGDGEAFSEQYLMIVFYPLFPWLVRALHGFWGGGWYTLGTLIQPFVFAWGGAALFMLCARRFGQKTAAWALAFLVAAPASFFYAVPMTESLYLAVTATAFLALEEEKPGWFAAFGLMAALTRSTGLLLAGAAGIYWLQKCRAEKRFCAWRWLFAAAGPAAGFGAYLLMNRLHYGNWLAFAGYLQEHWDQRLGLVPNTVRYLLWYLVHWWESNCAFALFVSLAALVCIFLQLGILVAQRKKLPLPWFGYALVYVAVTDGATWLLSAPRYLLSGLFFPLGLALCLPRRWQKALCLAGEIVLSVLYLGAYLSGAPIY